VVLQDENPSCTSTGLREQLWINISQSPVLRRAGSGYYIALWECLRSNVPILKATAIAIAAEGHVRTYSTNLKHRLYFLAQDESNVKIQQNHTTEKFKTAPILKRKKEGGCAKVFAQEERENYICNVARCCKNSVTSISLRSG
jgi:hypothetical protein